MEERNEIEREGTAADKAKLPYAMDWNKPHKEKRTFVMNGDARTDGQELWLITLPGSTILK